MPSHVIDSPPRSPGCANLACRGRRAAAGWQRLRRRAWPWIGLLAIGLALAAPPSSALNDHDPAALTWQVLDIVNRHRAGQALPAWAPDADLALIATAHSRRMALRQQIGHDGFETRFAQARRRLCVENLAAGFDRAEPLLTAWLASPSHRDNLLAPRPRQVGLGNVDGYITLLACD